METERSRKRDALEASLDTWYAEDAARKEQLERVVSGNAEFSLREIDWFVTNYSARNPVVYSLPNGKVVDVNGDYKDVLRSFHKVGFDAFKRKGSDPSEAHIRQKNFFKWAIENGVVDYVSKHAKEIQRDMSSVRKRRKISPGEEAQDAAIGSTFRKVFDQGKKASSGMGVVIRSSDTVFTIPSFISPQW